MFTLKTGLNLAPFSSAPFHDLHATMLHCLGIEHTRLTYKTQGLDMRLTGVEPSQVIKGILG